MIFIYNIHDSPDAFISRDLMQPIEKPPMRLGGFVVGAAVGLSGGLGGCGLGECPGQQF
jgi:hypothetical protein